MSDFSSAVVLITFILRKTQTVHFVKCVKKMESVFIAGFISWFIVFKSIKYGGDQVIKTLVDGGGAPISMQTHTQKCV